MTMTADDDTMAQQQEVCHQLFDVGKNYFAFICESNIKQILLDIVYTEVFF